MALIAVVDDEPDIRAMLVDYLTAAGHRVVTAGSAVELETRIEGGVPDLFVLDVGLPGQDGFTVARTLRGRFDAGIVMLTGAGDLIDRVAGLEAGADDYLEKPVALAELGARIDAVLRRRRPGGDGLRFGPYWLDLGAFCLRDGRGEVVGLSPMEVDLVAAFAMNPGRLLSRDELMRLAPPRDGESLDRSIDHRITRLRRKLEADPEHPDLIRTVRGAGYLHQPSG